MCDYLLSFRESRRMVHLLESMVAGTKPAKLTGMSVSLKNSTAVGGAAGTLKGS